MGRRLGRRGCALMAGRLTAARSSIWKTASDFYVSSAMTWIPPRQRALPGLDAYTQMEQISVAGIKAILSP